MSTLARQTDGCLERPTDDGSGVGAAYRLYPVSSLDSDLRRHRVRMDRYSDDCLRAAVRVFDFEMCKVGTCSHPSMGSQRSATPARTPKA